MHRTMRGVFHGVALVKTREMCPNSRKAALHFAANFISAKLLGAAFEMSTRHAVCKRARLPCALCMNLLHSTPPSDIKLRAPAAFLINKSKRCCEQHVKAR